MNLAIETLQPLTQWSGITEAQLLPMIFACGAVLALSILWLSHRRTSALSRNMDRLQHDLRVANSSAIGMGQQLLCLEKKLHGQKQKVQQISQEKANEKSVKLTVVDKHQSSQRFANDIDLPADAVYEKSRQLLAQGADIQEVIKQSGLSYSEVSLMKTLAR
ncbi:MAG: hypothetical protein ACI9NY_002456 [Kiritimatiellia bacterium]|jgi:hypothetical protein